MDIEAFREIRELKGGQLVAWWFGYLVYVAKVVLITSVSQGNVISNAVGAFVLVCAIAMDNATRKETVIELVKLLQDDIPSYIAWLLVIILSWLFWNLRKKANDKADHDIQLGFDKLAQEPS